MSTKSPGAGANPSTSSRPHRETDGREAARAYDSTDRHRTTEIFVTDRAVVVASPDHTRIERPPFGTDYAEPLPPETRAALAEVADG